MSSVQTGPHHSPRRTQSWRDGQSTSTTFWTCLPPSMMKRLLACHRST
jgi:hypothetical protein